MHDWKDFIGARSETVTNLVEQGAVRRFAEAVGDANPLYTDEAAAKNSRYGRIVAPPTFPRIFDYGEIEGLSNPGQGFLHGEHRTSYERPLLAGEEVRCYTEVRDYYEKESRGGTLGFLVTERVGESPEGERIFVMEDVAVLTPAIRANLEGVS